MNFYRETIKSAPSMVAIPREMQNRAVEIIILPLDEQFNNGDAGRDEIERDANGYPIGFFERTYGSLPDFPEREPQPPAEIREEI